MKLFGFRDIDGHFVIIIFNITIRIKHKVKIESLIPNGFGLNIEEKRNKKIIVSMTTYPDRINTVHLVIERLLCQTVKPDKLILFLAESQFKGIILPGNLTRLKDFGLEIQFVKEDIKSYKKLIPALKMFPNDIIITFDDDINYEKDAIERLYTNYLKNPENIYTARAVRLYKEKDKYKFYNKEKLYFYTDKLTVFASFNNVIIGCGGVLYPPNSLHNDIFNLDKIKIIPTQDDIFFWAMAVLKGTKIQMTDGFKRNLYTVKNSQEKSLSKINNNINNGIKGDIAVQKILEYYPEIKERLV